MVWRHLQRRRQTVCLRSKSIEAEGPIRNAIEKTRQRVGLQQILPELERLNRLTETDRPENLKTCNGPFVDCLCKCIINLLKGRVPLKPKQLEDLRRYERLLRKAALKNAPRSERRRILQKGGFIGAVLPPLILGLGALLSPLVGRLMSENGER
jgi:hypothetical protein